MTTLPDINRIRTQTRSIVRRWKRFLPVSVLVITSLVVVSLIVWTVRRATTAGQDADLRAVVPEAKASSEINKDFEFPILDSKGKEVTRLKYTVQNAELRDRIIVNGKMATSVRGRTFLIVSLKIVNDYDGSLEVKVSDYFRLTVNGKDNEYLAPEIHSDPVTAQAKATKSTRIGFPVNDTDTNKILWVGEIKGEKQRIDLSL